MDTLESMIHNHHLPHLDADKPDMSFLEIEHEFENMNISLWHISSNVEKLTGIVEKEVKEIRQDLKEWRKGVDEHIVEVNSRCAGHQSILTKMENHMVTDKPVEHYLGKWAIAVVMFVATMAGTFVINRILHIAAP